MSIRTSCSAIAMEVSGSEPTSGGSSMYIQGRTDIFKKSDGLSGDIICSLFEDREGNIWVSTAGGLDRFREFPVALISEKQGLSSDSTYSVIAAMDGSVWVGTHSGLTRCKNLKLQSFARRMDCRMMRRILCLRTIVGESGRSEFAGLLISRTADLLP